MRPAPVVLAVLAVMVACGGKTSGDVGCPAGEMLCYSNVLLPAFVVL